MDFILGAQASTATSTTTPNQLDLLLQAAYSSLLSSSSASSFNQQLNLLNLAVNSLGQPTLPQQWPSPLPIVSNGQLSYQTQIDPLALALPHPGAVPMCPLVLSLLPTCSLPDFHARLLAASLPSVDPCQPGPSPNAIALDLPLPSPSDTSASGSVNSCNEMEQEKRGNSEEFEGKMKNESSRAHRLSYPREFKLVVLHSFWTNGQNKYRTCKEFQITKSMLNGWLQKAEKIRNSRPGSLKSGRSGRRPQFPKIERQLFDLFRAQMAKGEAAVTNKWIRENARRLAELELDFGRGEETGQCQFSERWLNNFKRRFGIQTSPNGDGELVLGGGEEAKSADLDEAKMADGGKMGEKGEGDGDGTFHPENLSSEQLAKIGRQICCSSSPGQLPIQAFYARFPKIVSDQATVAVANGRNGGMARK